MDVRNRRAMLTLVALVAGLAGTASAYDWGWSLVRQLTTTPDNSQLPTSGNGFANMTSHVHVIFADKQGSLRVLYYIRSVDHGSNWQAPVVVEERSSSNVFSIAADSVGNVHVINRRYSDNALWYKRSGDTGATWQEAVQIAADCDNAVLLTNHSQNVYICNVVPGAPPMIDLYKSTNGGADWSSLGTIGYAENFSGLRGCISNNGTINLFYSYGGSGSARVFQLRSTNDGASWSSELQVTGVPQNSGAEGAWMGGNVVFLATSTFGNPANFRRSIDGGATWESGQTLPVMADCATWTTDNTAHILGVRGDTAVVWIKSTNNGSSWSTPWVISGPERGTRSSPYVGCDDAFRLNAVWGSLQTGNLELFTAFADTTLGIAEPGAGRLPVNRLDLAPSPVRRTVHLGGAAAASVFDRNGRMVGSLVAGANDVARLESGVYFVRAGEAATRFVKLP